jgi:hypothetical protein
MMLSIVMPTIAGREVELARSMEAYERLTPVKVEWIVERDHSTCAAAWNAGAPKATGEILHMGADDIEPENAGWFIAAMLAIDDGCIPLGWVREDWGTFGRDFPRVVICRRGWWRNIDPKLHYYSDNLFGDLMAAAGHPAVAVDGFDFYHRHSMVGRDDSPERVERDREVYEQVVSDLHQRARPSDSAASAGGVVGAGGAREDHSS